MCGSLLTYGDFHRPFAGYAARPLCTNHTSHGARVTRPTAISLGSSSAVKVADWVGAFIPTVETAIVVSDLATSALLFAQFSIVHRSALLVLASGYLFRGGRE